MNLEKHLHRTEVVSAIMALWAEHEELSFNDLMYKYDLGAHSDEGIIKVTKDNLAPKKPYILIQVDEHNKQILGGQDRVLVSQDEYPKYLASLNLPEQQTVYIAMKNLSDAEVVDVNEQIEQLKQQSNTLTPEQNGTFV